MKFIRKYVAPIIKTLLLAFVCFSAKAQTLEPEHPLMQSMQYSTDSVGPNRFVAAHGRRAIIMGYPQTGLEIWAYPFQILDNYQVSFRPSGANAAKDGRLLLRRIDYRPDSVTRIYVGPDFLVRERLFVPIDEAAVTISYEVEGVRPLDIEIHFLPVLNLMWPGGLGGQYTRWKDVTAGSNGIPGFVIAGQANEYTAIIGSREITTHDDTVNSTVLTEHGFSFSLHPSSSSKHTSRATVYVALNPANKESTASLQSLSDRLTNLEVEATKHYAVLEASSLRIHTPDEEINRSLSWAKVALDQAWVCNVKLGCGIVAGYGPSRDALRPQYAWFFGGDGLVATNALVSAGEYTRARDELTFIQKYQNPANGMIWHELSQSAGFIDWSKYPYMYVHVDISFDYLITLSRYVAASGDVAFAEDHWNSIAAAYAYCLSSIKADHLPHIPPDKEASDEQHRPDDDLSLSASWMAAAAGYAQLASLTHHASQADSALLEVGFTRKAIAAHYWNSSKNFWFDGHMASGEPIFREAIGPTQLIAQNVFSAEQNKALLDRLTSADFQTDWGTREVAASSRDYNPYSYGAGSVSPLSTLAAAVSLWQVHRPESAFAVWKSVIGWNSLDSPGHIHEVLAGNFYHEQTESVPEQTWSSAALFDATMRGLFGLDIDATNNSIHLAPHLPGDWHEASLENIRLPHSTLTLTIKQGESFLDLDVSNEGAPTSIIFSPQIPLGAHLLGAEFQGQAASVTMDSSQTDEHARLTLRVPSGRSHCHLRFSGGISISTNHSPLRVGGSSSDPKIVNLSLEGKILTIEADIHPDQEAVLQIRTPWKITAHAGATVHSMGDDQYEIHILQGPLSERISSTSVTGYTHTRTSLTFIQ